MTASTDIIIFLVSFLVIYVSIQAPESIMYTPINDSFDVRLLKIVLIIYRRLYDIISMAVVENDHYSPFELRNVTSRVNTVSNDLFESNEKKTFLTPRCHY